jgi:hypothetical protein
MKLTFKKTNIQNELDEFFTPEDQRLIKKLMGMYLAFIVSIIISVGLVAAAVIYFAVQCIKGAI